MILLVDAGNSRIKWATSAKGRWLARGQLPTPAAAELVGQLPEGITASVLSVVAGDSVEATLRQGLARLGPVHGLRAAAHAHGLVNRYEPPERLGADRYAALIGARRAGLAPCVVASVGTALTVDALAEDGVFLGGGILAGRQLLRQALAAGTAGVGDAQGECVDWPRSTADAVATASQWAMRGVLETARSQLAATLGRPVPLVLTGGEAAWLAPCLAPPWQLHDDLILEGLRWVAQDLNAPGA